MIRINRRRFVSASIAGLGIVALPIRSAEAKKKKKRGQKGASFRLTERHELRFKVTSKKLHSNGRLFVMVLGKPDGEDHFKDDFITYGPFGDGSGVTKSIFLPAGSYEFRIDGGFVEYAIELQARSSREKHESGAEFRTIASKSGRIAGKG